MKKLFSYLIIAASALAVGGITGFGAKKIFTKVVDYNDVGFEAFVPDYDKIVKKIDSFKGSKKEVVNKFSAVEVVNYSLEKFRRCENCFTITRGISHTSVVEQYIRGCNIKRGNEYFEESLSKSSLVSVASRCFATGKGGEVSLYHGGDDSIVISDQEAFATYSDTKSLVDSKTYKETYGKTLDEMFIYLICDDGLLHSELKETEQGYQYVLDLDTEISTYFDKLQMKNTSNLDAFPVFKDVTLTFDLDKNLVLKKCNIDEDYNAKKVVSAKAHAVIDIDFYADEIYEIPTLEEHFNYCYGE